MNFSYRKNRTKYGQKRGMAQMAHFLTKKKDELWEEYLKIDEYWITDYDIAVMEIIDKKRRSNGEIETT